MTGLRQSAATFNRGALSKFGFIALAYLDLLLTLVAMQHGFSEMNPFMARFLTKPMELFLVKVAAPPFIAWLVPSKLLLPSIALVLAITGWNIAELVSSL